jgi:3-methylfumaryl-CoA hydratase
VSTRTTVTEVLAPEPARALAGLLDASAPDGDELPPLWHCAYLLDRPAQADLGPDGHARTTVPTPPAGRLRRMFAGGRVRATAPLRIGREATRTSRVLRTVERQGRTGPLIFRTVGHDYTQDGVLVLTEEHDLVYRQPAAGGARPEPAAPVASLVDGERAVRVDPTLLFRFSALTYNAHRIHYDRGFARTEGYPGLLVHGPLQALLMAHQAAGTGTVHTGHPYRFDYRLDAPLFDHQGLVVGAAGGSTWVRDAAGRRTASGTCTTPGMSRPGHG